MQRLSGKLLNGVVALAIALAVVFTAHAATSHSKAKSHAIATSGTFREVGFISPDLALAKSLDPAMESDVYSSSVAGLVYDGLFKLNANTKVSNDLAASVKISKNKKVYTITLRSAHFSNGDPVTAADVVYSVKRALKHSANSPVAYYDDLIVGYANYNAGKSNSLGVKALNSKTVQFKITTPAPYFEDELAYNTNWVLDKKVVGSHGASATNDYLTNNCSANIGSGPFMFQCASKGSGVGSFYKGTHEYTLVPNPHYFGPKPHIKIVVQVAGTDETAYNEYLAGQTDAVGVPSDHVLQYLHKHNKQFHDVTSSAISYTSLNTTTAPFDNKSCRLAYAYGIDRVDMAKVINYENKPWYEIVPKAFLGYFKPTGVPKDNMAKAKADFAACGAEAKTPFELVYAAGGTTADKIAQTEAASEKAVGFDVTAKALQLNDWVTDITEPLAKTGTIAVEQGWIMDYPDPQDYMDLWLSNNPYDISGFSNKTYDKLVNQADKSFNTKLRQADYAKAARIALNNGTPIMSGIQTAPVLVKTSVHGLVYTFSCASGCPPPGGGVPQDWANVTVK